jgi:hypothetical protein
MTRGKKYPGCKLLHSMQLQRHGHTGEKLQSLTAPYHIPTPARTARTLHK